MKYRIIADSVALDDDGPGQIMGYALVVAVVRITMGAFFFLSGILKLINQDLFVKALKSYGFASNETINAAAFVVPQVEMLMGTLLALGLWASIVSRAFFVMILALTCASAIALMQGRAVDCGCFPVEGETNPIGLSYFLRNGLLLCSCLWIARKSFRAQSAQQLQTEENHNRGCGK